jgi:hypothetical protein
MMLAKQAAALCWENLEELSGPDDGPRFRVEPAFFRHGRLQRRQESRPLQDSSGHPGRRIRILPTDQNRGAPRVRSFGERDRDFAEIPESWSSATTTSSLIRGGAGPFRTCQTKPMRWDVGDRAGEA